MKTDELIAILASNEARTDRNALRLRALGLLAVGVFLSFLMVYFLLHLNPALGTIVSSLWFWVRFAFVASLAGLSWWTLRRLGKPGLAGKVRWWPLLLPFAALAALATALLMRAPGDARVAMLLGVSWQVCSMTIALVSLPLFVAAIAIVRSFAPIRLRFTGATLGLFAGAMAALVYTLHCPELSPAFLVVWYSLGMLIPAVIGALIGERLLRW